MSGTAQTLDRFTYWAVSAVVERMVDIGPVESVREGWYEGDCLCGNWSTSGAEPVVEGAAREHVTEAHAAQVAAEKVFLAAARAYCETKYDYPPDAYVTPDAQGRHIQADTATHACGEAFRAAVKAAVDAGLLAADGDAGIVVHLDSAGFELWRH